MNQFLENRFLKNVSECKELKFASNVALEKGLQINDTKLQFTNQHGRQVDVTHTPKLIATYYQDQTTKVATNEITSDDKQMHKIGIQFAHLNMLMHKTGTA